MTIAATPTVNGRSVSLRVVTSDPDAKAGCGSVDFGDTTITALRVCPVPGCIARFGSWTPLPPEPGSDEQIVEHTYDRPGVYTVTVRASTQMGCYDPYYSSAEQTLQVTIL